MKPVFFTVGACFFVLQVTLHLSSMAMATDNPSAITNTLAKPVIFVHWCKFACFICIKKNFRLLLRDVICLLVVPRWSWRVEAYRGSLLVRWLADWARSQKRHLHSNFVWDYYQISKPSRTKKSLNEWMNEWMELLFLLIDCRLHWKDDVMSCYANTFLWK